MREEYDFSNPKKNPYVKKQKEQVAIDIDMDIIEHFKEMSDKSGVPYQTLMNLCLRDYIEQKRRETEDT